RRRLYGQRNSADLQDVLRESLYWYVAWYWRRRPRGHVWRSGKDGLERPRLMDRWQHRRGAGRTGRQWHCAQREAGVAQDLAVVRFGVRLDDHGRVPL